MRGMASRVPARGEPLSDVSGDSFHQVLFENEAVRILRVELPPGRETSLHRHDRDYVMTVLGKAEVRESRQGQEPVVRNWEAGQAVFLEGNFVHQVRNLGKEPFRAVLVEVKR
jgi:quercetin dioxygenase-like cupin family protein